MKIKRSSRHAHISGNFGEALVLYWLSKHDFECARVDHTGIDIIAENKHTKERMGISVKCRTRPDGKESDSVNITPGDLTKIEESCLAFGCAPYFAIVVDAKYVTRVFITRKEHFIQFAQGSNRCYWGMTENHLETYKNSEHIMAFESSSKALRWWE